MFAVHRMAVSSSVFATMLRPFLFENTAHFVHELLLFSRSSLDMAAYDKRALYDDQAVESRSVRYLAQFPVSSAFTHTTRASQRASDVMASVNGSVGPRHPTPPRLAEYARAVRHLRHAAAKGMLEPIIGRPSVQHNPCL